MKYFSKTLLISVFSSLLLLGAVVANADDTAADAMNERLKPVGTVCVQGEKCEGVVVAAAATSGATGGSARSADEIIGAHCGACHTTGVLGAPKIGDSAEWKKRVKEQGGLDKLLARAISGFNAMPPKGTCSDCTKDEIKSVITKMSGLSF